ncbi:hypothetical protein DRJ48_01925 [Candidatus Woesearchaeota archaeon]|nr:hypothetical protein [Candidatus Woesearchaeota archaeon]RLE43068.1 MAG: hypothetical protein DRJ48_01925 [Candidatus Woesearchaeota archaeon]
MRGLHGRRVPRHKGGLLVTDLHNHPDKAVSIDYLVEICTHGIIGFSHHPVHARVMGFEEAISALCDTIEQNKRKDLCIEVLEPGLARITHDSTSGERVGYAVNTQEVIAGMYHILAVGCPEILPKYTNPLEAVEAIHSYGGLAILNHPFWISKHYWFGELNGPWSIENADGATVRAFEQLCEKVDAIEVFNAQFTLSKRVNDMAKSIARDLGKPGVFCSDSHPKQYSEFTVGVYLDVPNSGLTIEYINESIARGEFEPSEERYVSPAVVVLTNGLLLLEGKLRNVGFFRE